MPLDQFLAGKFAPFAGRSVEEVMASPELAARRDSLFGDSRPCPEPKVKVRDSAEPGVPVRIYEPLDERTRAIAQRWSGCTAAASPRPPSTTTRPT